MKLKDLNFYKQLQIDYIIKNFIDTLNVSIKDNNIKNYNNFLKSFNPIFTEGFFVQIQSFLDIISFNGEKYEICKEKYNKIIITYSSKNSLILTIDMSKYNDTFSDTILKNALNDIIKVIETKDIYSVKILNFYNDIIDNRLDEIKKFFHNFVSSIMESDINKIIGDEDTDIQGILKSTFFNQKKKSELLDVVRQKLTDAQQENIKKHVLDFFSEIEDKHLFCKILFSELLYIFIKNTENNEVKSKYNVISDCFKEMLCEFKITDKNLYNNYLLNYKDICNIFYNYITNDQVKFYEIVQVINKIMPSYAILPNILP